MICLFKSIPLYMPEIIKTGRCWQHSKRNCQRIERPIKPAHRLASSRCCSRARDGIPVSIFADASVKEAPVQFTHPPELSRRIQPAPLVPESWRIKVAEFSEPTAARRLTAMLNHRGRRFLLTACQRLPVLWWLPVLLRQLKSHKHRFIAYG